MIQVKAKTEQARFLLQAAADGDFSAYSLQGVNSNHNNHNGIKIRCTSGCTPLHYAAGGGHEKLLRHMLDQNHDLDCPYDVNEKATGKASGRTPLHYAARNGQLHIVQLLIETYGANPDSRAKHGVTPFQLAVWQNRLSVCRYLVHKVGVDPAQVNDFQCGAVHWVGLCPTNRLKEDKNIDGSSILPMLRWLAGLDGIDFHLVQKQGHTSLHKAAWGGHLAVIHFLKETIGMIDNLPDDAGNYAADLADMASTPRHTKVAQYLRHHCSSARDESLRILGLVRDDRNKNSSLSDDEIRRAYLSKARLSHPDKCGSNGDFDAIRKAYEHLTVHDGVGNQSNASHSLKLMLTAISQDECDHAKYKNDQSVFKAQLLSVLLEYGDKGIELSNIKKKWKQVWPQTPFPTKCSDDESKKNLRMLDFIKANAGDVVNIKRAESRCGYIVHPKECFLRSRIAALNTQ